MGSRWRFAVWPRLTRQPGALVRHGLVAVPVRHTHERDIAAVLFALDAGVLDRLRLRRVADTNEQTGLPLALDLDLDDLTGKQGYLAVALPLLALRTDEGAGPSPGRKTIPPGMVTATGVTLVGNSGIRPSLTSRQLRQVPTA
jgi:hypothetical protein